MCPQYQFMAEINQQVDATQILSVLESNPQLLQGLLNKMNTKRTHEHVCGSLTQKGAPCQIGVEHEGDLCVHHRADKITCVGTTKDGKACKVAVKEEGDKCRHHSESIIDKQKCTGHKKNGDPCGNPQPKDSDRCHLHKE